MSPRQRPVAVAVLLAVSAAVLAAVAGPASACSCADLTAEFLEDRADVIFTGVVLEVADPHGGRMQVSSGDPLAWLFEVEDVEQGDVRGPVWVRSARSEASCGFPFERDGRYRVLARGAPGELRSGLCDGTAAVDLAADVRSQPGGGVRSTTQAGEGGGANTDLRRRDGAPSTAVVAAVATVAATALLAGAIAWGRVRADDRSAAPPRGRRRPPHGR